MSDPLLRARAVRWFLLALFSAGPLFLPTVKAQEKLPPYRGNQPRIYAERSPSRAQLHALDALERFARGDVRVRWDPETGSPAALSGRLSPPFLGAAGEGALRFVSDRAALLFPDPPPVEVLADPRRAPLRVARVTRRGPVDHVTLLQYHGDLLVLRGGYTVSQRRRPGPAGREVLEVVSALGSYFGGIPEDLDTTPSLEREEALAIARRAVAPGADPMAPPAWTLLVYPLGGSFHLAWRVEFRTKVPFGRWEVFVDAHSGEVLEVQDRIIYGNVTGQAWMSNPVHDASPVDIPLRDANVTISGQTVVTDAAGNFYDGGAGSVTTSLVGPYLDVENEDVPDAAYTGSPNVYWNYPVWDTHFDEVNVFYHANAFHDFVKTDLGYGGADVQLPAVVHYGDFFDNAFYDGMMIAFGDGDGFYTGDFAQDDVICHEYSHFLFDRAIQMGYGYNEVGAMNEGGADYFACTFTNDSVNGESVDFMGWWARDLDNKNFNPPRIYPDFLIDNGFEPHYGGEVWGGAVWDVRKAIGPEATDRIAFEGLFYLPPDPLFIDGRAGIVQADIDLYLGAHKLIIEQLMFERGIGPPPDTDPFVRIRAEPQSGIAPLPVLFQGIVVDDGVIQSLYWDFGDGNVVPNGALDMSHVYTSAGTYTVTLVATDNTSASASYSIQVEVSLPGEIAAGPEERDIGFVRSDVPGGNFFGDDDVYAGYLAGLDYHGAALFHVPVIPGGTGDLVFDSATVEFTGQDDTAKGPAGGIWSLKMLTDDVDVGWRTRGYVDIVGALPLYVLDSSLDNADLAPGVTNVFTVTSDQLPALHSRVRFGTLSFRMDGPFGSSNLFSWDSGYDRFGEDPTATRIKPVLRLAYTQSRAAGDVNADGVVDSTDARLVAEAAVNMRTLQVGDWEAGDVDRNGELDARDAAAILAKEAGLIDF